ncbi:peptidoglycan DD-metalloendopeptidase family protein [Lysobacter sp. F6437]|uniref:peptidoglycan DD-metalloendopeptidase family protein n=1 Tax=Lysobacter sp. F6437 TaxID=3459296 RepID=UPI00403DF66D
MAAVPGARAAEVRNTVDLHVPAAPAPVTVDGRAQLVYELQIGNVSDFPITLAGVEVRADGQALTTLAPAQLDARLGRPGMVAAGDAPRTLAPGMRSTLYLEVAVPPQVRPQALSHGIDYVLQGSEGPVTGTVEGGRVTVDPTPPPVLSPPLRGGPWAAVHHPDWPRGHRRMVYAVNGRATIPGRFAIDFIKLDAQGRQADGDADRIPAWFGHGEEVLAVADGVVVAVRDDMPESASLAAHPDNALGDATGNYVALQIAPDRYAFYEHLQPGSVRVAAGQRVHRGEVLGALGFTGDSTGPHLHFHLADANSPLDAEGVPFVLDRFRVLGGYESLDNLGSAPWQPLAPGAEADRTAERPAPNRVLQFRDR